MIFYYYTILSYQQYSSTFNIDLFFTCCVFTATIRDNDENVYEWGDKCKWLPRDASKNWLGKIWLQEMSGVKPHENFSVYDTGLSE